MSWHLAHRGARGGEACPIAKIDTMQLDQQDTLQDGKNPLMPSVQPGYNLMIQTATVQAHLESQEL